MKRTALDKYIFLRQGVWTFKKHIPGRRSPLQISLETDNRELAREKRDAELKKLAAGELAEIRGPRLKRATLGQVLAAYSAGIHTVTQIEPRSARKCAQHLRLFWRWATSADGGPAAAGAEDAVLISQLIDSKTVRAFTANYLAAAGTDREAIQSRRRGAEAVLRNMRAVFSKSAQRLYKDLHLPPLADFLRAARMDTEDRKHGTIGATALQQMEAAINAGPPTVSPDLWLVHYLHKFAGLRNDEVLQARVEWFTRAPWGQVFIGVIRRPYFEPKQSEGFVPLAAEVAARLAPGIAGRAPLDFLVLPTGTPAARVELVNRQHAQFIRRFLPAAQFAKAGYELRRWAAQVFELKHGKDAAENFLRHKRAGVAAAHYLDEWARWRRLGSDLGITLAEARGESTIEVLGTWATGAAAFGPTALATVKSQAG